MSHFSETRETANARLQETAKQKEPPEHVPLQAPISTPTTTQWHLFLRSSAYFVSLSTGPVENCPIHMRGLRSGKTSVSGERSVMSTANGPLPGGHQDFGGPFIIRVDLDVHVSELGVHSDRGSGSTAPSGQCPFRWHCSCTQPARTWTGRAMPPQETQTGSTFAHRVSDIEWMPDVLVLWNTPTARHFPVQNAT